MKPFLAVYTGSPAAMAAWEALPEAERARRQADGLAAWKRWVDEHREVILDLGGPLGRTLQVDGDGVAGTRNALAGYVLVQAPTHEDAARLFVGHPHFTHFPGEAVEVMEVLAIPAG